MLLMPVTSAKLMCNVLIALQWPVRSEHWRLQRLGHGIRGHGWALPAQACTCTLCSAAVPKL